jgi:hypothetical protein
MTFTTGEELMEGPTIYARLMQPATMGLIGEVQQRLNSEASKAANSMAGWVHEQIRQAYVAGVRDGYAQGVAAADDAETVESSRNLPPGGDSAA